MGARLPADVGAVHVASPEAERENRLLPPRAFSEQRGVSYSAMASAAAAGCTKHYYNTCYLSGIDLENCVKMVNNTIQGLLGADIVGFHTLGYSRHMQRCIELFCDIEVSGSDSVSFQGRTVKIAKFPIGVDDSAWRALAATPEVQSRVAQIRAECDNRRIILSVDRLDYTKGTMFL